MPGQRDLVEIIHAGTAESAVADGKSGRLNKMDIKPETRGKAEHCAGILGDIGLEQCDSHDSHRVCHRATRVCHRATAARRPDRPKPINNWYKSPAMAA